MLNNLLDFSKYESPDSKFTSELQPRGGNITFSNSGQRGIKKYFNLSLDSFLNCLKDIRDNHKIFLGHENYVEREWRDLGSEYFIDGPANAQITVQTKPMFATLSKIIMWANDPKLNNNDPEQVINLDSESLDNAIRELEKLSDRFTPKDVIKTQSKSQELSSKSIRDFALMVFNYFYGDNWNRVLEDSQMRQSTINSTTYNTFDHEWFKNLIGGFDKPQTKESLSSSNTLRFFEEPIYTDKENYYYFTTQWNAKGEYNLSFDNLKNFVKNRFPLYEIVKESDFFVLRLKKRQIEKNSFNLSEFSKDIEDSGLIFSDQLIKRFVASIWTKPFVICSGLSGSGKTKLAQTFAMWICQDKSQYEIVPVGADWTNREPLLGYPNALDEQSYVKPENGILQLILNAKTNENLPYFLILDEMNLSHVERYFADFLSTMESKEAIPLHKIDNEKSGAIPQKLTLPSNLFIIGTVNIDETTYMFSPKVLDRANTIEFRLSEDDLEKFMASDIPLDLGKLEHQGATMAEDFVRIAQSKTTSSLDKYKDDIVKFFGELQKSGAEFGYRTTSEIGQLISHLESLGEANDNLLDIAIMQKLLPKLHGSRTKLTKTLVTLGGFCLVKKEDNIKANYFDNYINNSLEKPIENDDNVKYKLSFEKICRMYKNAVENGFASYAEA